MCCKSVKPKFHITERPRQSEGKKLINFVPHEHWKGLRDIQCARMHHLLLCYVCNKRVYLVRRDIVHGIYQGVLYFLNIVRFHVAHDNVLCFTNVRTALSFRRRFTGHSEMLGSILFETLESDLTKIGQYM